MEKPKKPIASSLAMVLAVVAIAVSVAALHRSTLNTNQTQSESVLTKIQHTGKMEVCYGVYPPAVIKDAKTGALSGHDIDALKLIAQRIGATAEFHEQTFGNMAAALQSGTCDVTTAFFAQIPRAAVVAFTQPLYFIGESALIRKGDTRFNTLDDIDKPGIKVAVANGESGYNYVKEHFKNAQLDVIDVESSDLSRFLLEVTAGRADVGIADSETIRLFAAQHPETQDLFANNPFNINPTNYAVRQGDTDFLNFINTSVQYLETTGEFQALEQKYGAHWLHEVKQYQPL